MRTGFCLIGIVTLLCFAFSENTSASASCMPVGACIFEDLFNDNVVDWSIVKPNVTESGGVMILSSSRKAIATSPTTFDGCSACTVSAEISLSGGVNNKAWILTHRIDQKNQVEIIIREALDKIVAKLKLGGVTLVKKKAVFALLPNTVYCVSLTYDGAFITITIDGAEVIKFDPGEFLIGTIGFQSKGGSMSVDRVCVN